jgi:hypothetical protein
MFRYAALLAVAVPLLNVQMLNAQTGLVWESRPAAEWAGGLSPAQRQLVEKLNRRDAAHWGNSALVRPVEWPAQDDGDELEVIFRPFALDWPTARTEAKALYVDLRLQAFGAYENGRLVRWGPISSGAQATPTKRGLYYLNWRARLHTSTANEDWKMPWYFNFDNFEGLGLHQYSLPGAPASHGCLRLLEADAKWLYQWGNGWQLSEDGRQVLSHGTPIMIQGEYAFSEAPPWLKLNQPSLAPPTLPTEVD